MQEETYEAVDLALAAWFRREGIRLLRTERRGRAVWLIYDDAGGRASKAAGDFYNTQRGRAAYQMIASYKALRNWVLDIRDGRAA